MSFSSSIISNLEKGTYHCKYGETAKLNHLNYTQWRRDIEFFLQAEQALSIVLGEESCPQGPSTNASDFDKRAGIGAAIIHASCESLVKAYLHGLRDPHVMWEELKVKLDTANSRAGRTAILRKFNQLRPASNSSVADYITQLLECSKELSGTEQAIPKETFISHLLTTLPKSFDSIIDIITYRPEAEQTADRVISTLVEWEASNRTRKTETEPTKPTSPTTALVTYSGRRFRGRGSFIPRGTFDRSRQQNRSSFRAPPYSHRGSLATGSTCWYCLRPGHRQDSCDLRKRAEEAKSERGGMRPRRNGGRESEEAGAAFASVKALAGVVGKRTSSDNTSLRTWIVDSGASHHLSCDRLAFSSLKRLAKPTTVFLGDNSPIFATGYGEITIPLAESNLKFQVLYVPELTYSLLSVSCLSVENKISFQNGFCFIQCKDSEQEKLASLHGGLYHVTVGVKSVGASPSATALATSLPSFSLWHQRLAHLSNKSLSALIPKEAYQRDENTQESLCQVCIKAKHTGKFERKPQPRATKPFELLHSDLCGPINPSSKSGFRYFILYIDDFTRVTWVYFLQTKSSTEVVSVFQDLQARIEKQYPDWPITRFRCDNGRGEYDNSLFPGILRVGGIAFEPSPPYTQSKNGVSERMIRTIVRKARAMLIDSKLNDDFWAEAVSTAVYLHARTPSQSISGATPYEKLTGKKPELGHLRRFGCAAYKFIPKELSKGKFSERSKECIFLGYVHDTGKIWRLWDLQSSRVMEASDIVFDELRVLGTRDEHGGEVEILRSCISEDIPPEEDSDMLSPPGVLSSTQALPALEEVAGLVEQTAPAPPRVQVEDFGFKGTRECINSDLEIELDQSTPYTVTTGDRCEEASPAGSLSLDEPSQVPKVVNLRRS